MKANFIHATILAAMMTTTLCGQTGRSIEQIEPLLSNETIFVAHVDLTKVNVGGLLQYLDTVFPDVFKLEDAFETTPRDGLLDLERRRQQLLDLGCNEFYLVASLADMMGPEPLFVVPNRSRVDRARLYRLLMTGDADKAPRASLHTKKYEVRPFSDTLLVGAYTDRLTQLDVHKPVARTDITDALGTGKSLTAVFSASTDQRRVLTETSIPIPQPWKQLEPNEFGQVLKTVSLTANVSDKPRLQLSLKAANEDGANFIAAKYAQLMSILLPMAQQGVPNIEQLLDEIVQTRTGTEFTLSFNAFDPDVREVTHRVLKGPLIKARATAKRNGRINKMRQTIIAVINFESANGHLPPAASYSDEGKPLLSWRVAVLPYLGEVELYEQFRHNEPWDSEHNRTLINRMPDIYAINKNLADAGRTTLVVPSGEGTIFDRQVGTKTREIRDGTSKTIAMVEVDPVNAVIWTKPDDWHVDFQDPFNGVRSSNRDYFAAARCDGSVKTYQFDMDIAVWKDLLTRDGEAPVKK